MGKLVFKIGEETIPTVLGYDDYMASPFADVIGNGLKKFYDLRKQSKSLSGEAWRNNVMVFLGDRGTGKTSCLMSIKQIVSDERNDKEIANHTVFLPVIEPLFFDDKHNILDIFVGELYRNTKRLLDKWESKSKAEREDLRVLQGEFAKVKNALLYLDKSRGEELKEEQESLLALSEGVNLKKLMSNLVRSYLKCVGKEVLVITIDDVDLNISEAYEMMEQINKYLVIPQVVIMLAAKLDQLRNSIELYLTKKYDPIMEKTVSLSEVREMTDRYLDKLLPFAHRFLMPSINDYSGYGLEIIDKGETGVRKENVYGSLEFAVLSLIYQKCGYLFYNYYDTFSQIIPKNLRELRHLVTMLYELQDRTLSVTVHEWNKIRFKDYFICQWLHMLPREDREIALKIWNEKDYSKVNKLVIRLLGDRFQKLRNVEGTYEEGMDDPGLIPISMRRLIEITNSNNYAENISLGDVSAVLRYLRSTINNDSKLLLFFVTSFYSIRLYELYDEMTSAVDKEKFPYTGNGTNESLPKLMNVTDYRIPDYYKLVGRGFFTLIGDEFLPVSDIGQSREVIKIEGGLLSTMIQDIIEQYDQSKNCLNKPAFIYKLNLAEFIILCVSRKLEVGDYDFSGVDINYWREEETNFYFSKFDRKDKNLLFDITAPFLNMICPQFAYNRFSTKFYEIAETCKDSLLSKILNNDRRYGEDENVTSDLMSRMAIRNMEVLDNLTQWLSDRRLDKGVEKNYEDIWLLRDFFKSLNGDKGGYSVNTYLQNDQQEGSFHSITFTPISILGEFLDILISKDSDGGKTKQIRDELRAVLVNIFQQERKLYSNSYYTLGELQAILRHSSEKDIPKKDLVITKILKDNVLRSIKSDLLIDYLTQYDVYSQVLFTNLFEKKLFDKYRQQIEIDLRKQCEETLSEWQKETPNLEAAKSHLDFLHKQCERVTLQRRMAEVEIQNLKAQCEERKRQIAEEKTRKRVVEKDLEGLTRSIEVCEEELRQHRETKTSLENRLSTIELLMKSKSEGESVEIQVPLLFEPGKINIKENLLEKTYDRYKKEMMEIENKIEEIEARKEKLTNHKLSLQDSYQGYEERINKLNSEYNDISKAFETKQANILFRKEEEKRLVIEKADVKNKCDETKRKVRALKKEYDLKKSEQMRIMAVLSGE